MLIPLFFVTAVASQATPARDLRVVLMPLGLYVPAELNDPMRQVERTLEDAFKRHLPSRVVTYRELMDTVAELASSQLAGCDDTACLSGLADALQADVVVASRVQALRGALTLDATLMDRRGATSRRASVQAPGVEALLQGTEDLARALAVGSVHSLKDPLLGQRLGTSAAGVEALKSHMLASPTRSLTDAWTRVVLDHNQRPGALALAQGAGLLVVSALLGLSTVVLAPLLGLSAAATFYSGALGVPYYFNNTNVDPNATAPEADVNGRFPFPLLALAAPAALAALTAVASGLALAVVGAWATTEIRGRLRRVPVAVNGCCRNEKELRDAEQPSGLEQWGSRMAAVGAVGIALSPALGLLVATMALAVCLRVFLSVGPPNAVQWGPSIMLAAPWHLAASFLVSLLTPFFALVVGLGLGLGIAGLSILMVSQEGSRILD